MRKPVSLRAMVPVLLALLVVGLLSSACGDQPIAPMATAPPPDPPTPVPTFALAAPDLARGQQVFLDKQCVICHGNLGQGGVGPTLAGITLPFDKFLHIQRTAIPPKPRFNRAELPEQDAYDVYVWLQSIDLQAANAQSHAGIQLPAGEILGMTLWTAHSCDKCHGAFAQGSAQAPGLAHISYPYEVERAKMRQTDDDIPEHRAEFLGDATLKRLYKWLQKGANPLGGC